MRDILSIVALESGVEDDAPPSVERLVAALMDSPHLRDFLRLAVKPHLSALVREWRGEPKQRRNGPGRLLATALAQAAIAASAPDATVVPVFEPGRDGWLSLVRFGEDGDPRPLLRWTHEDLIAARDAYRRAGKRALHHAQFFHGLAVAVPAGKTVGEVFTPEQLRQLWAALSVQVSTGAKLDRAQLTELPDGA